DERRDLGLHDRCLQTLEDTTPPAAAAAAAAAVLEIFVIAAATAVAGGIDPERQGSPRLALPARVRGAGLQGGAGAVVGRLRGAQGVPAGVRRQARDARARGVEPAPRGPEVAAELEDLPDELVLLPGLAGVLHLAEVSHLVGNGRLEGTEVGRRCRVLRRRDDGDVAVAACPALSGGGGGQSLLLCRLFHHGADPVPHLLQPLLGGPNQRLLLRHTSSSSGGGGGISGSGSSSSSRTGGSVCGRGSIRGCFPFSRRRHQHPRASLG
ncbi:unnamed protein product, partial [Ectocarpus fasciculatus]